jgi:hypothetical protein
VAFFVVDLWAPGQSSDGRMEPRGEAQSGSVFIPGFEKNFYPVISPVRAFDPLVAACLSAAFRPLPKLSVGGLTPCRQ